MQNFVLQKLFFEKNSMKRFEILTYNHYTTIQLWRNLIF